MRPKKALAVRSILILLLAATLLSAVVLRGDAGARSIGLSRATRASLIPPVGPQLKSTAAGRIAFAAGNEIYLVNSDGSGLTQLTHSDSTVYNYQPALSPDATRVAFARIQSGQVGIALINIDGSGLRNLTTNNVSLDSEPAWSPDGSRIAFVRGFDPTSEGVANFSECGPVRIYVVDVDNAAGQPVNLTPGQHATDPAWSPDGMRIAFASNRDGNYDIYSMAIDGGDVQQLTRTESQEAEPAWSPDGTRIAYARDYLASNVDCGFVHTGRPGSLAVKGPDIYLMAYDGSNQIRLTETEHNIEPTWSPDGTSLAFVSFRGGASEIHILDPNYKGPFSITADSNYKSSPSWSRTDPR